MQQLDDIRAKMDVMAADRDQKADTICQLEGLISEMQQDNKRYAALNRDLNVRTRGIHTVTVTEKVSSGPRCQAQGAKAQHHKEACKRRQGRDHILQRLPRLRR